jgi:hypothetical protein
MVLSDVTDAAARGVDFLYEEFHNGVLSLLAKANDNGFDEQMEASHKNATIIETSRDVEERDAEPDRDIDALSYAAESVDSFYETVHNSVTIPLLERANSWNSAEVAFKQEGCSSSSEIVQGRDTAPNTDDVASHEFFQEIQTGLKSVVGATVGATAGVGEDGLKLLVDTGTSMSAALDALSGLLFDAVTKDVAHASNQLSGNDQDDSSYAPTIYSSEQEGVESASTMTESTNVPDLTLARTSSVVDAADSMSVESKPYASTLGAPTTVPLKLSSSSPTLSGARLRSMPDSFKDCTGDSPVDADQQNAPASPISGKVPRKVYSRFDAAIQSNASWQSKGNTLKPPNTSKASTKVLQATITSSTKPNQEDFMNELLQSAKKIKGQTLVESDDVISPDTSMKSILRKSKYTNNLGATEETSSFSAATTKADITKQTNKSSENLVPETAKVTEPVHREVIMKKDKNKGNRRKKKNKSLVGILKGKFSSSKSSRI